MASKHYPFRSEKAKQHYLALYDNEAAKWPIDSETKLIESQYGQTFVRISGPEDAPVVVLLPGKFTSSNMWVRNIEALSQDHRTIAVDTIDCYGRSQPLKPIQSIQSYVHWIDDLFDQLGLQKVHLIGQSFGGMLATQYALVHGDRLDSLTLLAPAATVCKISPSLLWRGALSLLPHPYFTRQMFAWLYEGLYTEAQDLALSQQNNQNELDLGSHSSLSSKKTSTNGAYFAADNANPFDQFVDTIYTASRCYQSSLPVTPPVLTDQQLQSITPPTLFLVGDNEKVYSAPQAVKRMNQHVPCIETAIIKHCAHDLPMTQSRIVNRKIIRFMESLQVNETEKRSNVR